MNTQIAKIAIVGEQIVESEKQAVESARFALDWNGSSEGDSFAECFVSEKLNDEDEVTGYEVRETWGTKATRTDDNGEVLSTFPTEAEAAAFANTHNDAALASWAKCDWIELPRPVDFIYFGGCERGGYPQSRSATIRATAGDQEIEATGFGSVTFLRDSHSPAALASAVEKLVEILSAPAPVVAEEVEE